VPLGKAKINRDAKEMHSKGLRLHFNVVLEISLTPETTVEVHENVACNMETGRFSRQTTLLKHSTFPSIGSPRRLIY
jgi:hypothetical protein